MNILIIFVLHTMIINFSILFSKITNDLFLFKLKILNKFYLQSTFCLLFISVLKHPLASLSASFWAFKFLTHLVNVLNSYTHPETV
jgi:hypothetical protein